MKCTKFHTSQSKKRVLLLDNYDSFTYTIALYFRELGYSVCVLQADSFVRVSELDSIEFSHLVISPGPNSPQEACGSVEAIRYYAGKKPILGICLGHQCIAYAFGGEIAQLDNPTHAKVETLYYTDSPLFAGIKKRPRICLYHSLYVKTLPSDYMMIAHDTRGVIMALAHKKLPIYGLQFHPEAILSHNGKQILRNFMCF